ncbi:hypothetical protein GCM10007100_03240 [Roseibacillus persicicus]|uniref:Uncharacterized protein n=1 Tax=Roseibacillus persicicus TaxID=454148 RepID=A0A918WFC9_9BACT|nr:hypothetical protein GCM10007100_03240 [Roseibacillus persicicus]
MLTPRTRHSIHFEKVFELTYRTLAPNLSHFTSPGLHPGLSSCAPLGLFAAVFTTATESSAPMGRNKIAQGNALGLPVSTKAKASG